MQITTTEVNHTEHWVRLDEPALKQLITEAVAKAAGVDLDSAGVSIERCWISRSSGGLSSGEYSAEVMLKVDRP